MRGTTHTERSIPHDDTDLIRSMEAFIEHLDRIAEAAVRLAAKKERDAELVAAS